MVQILGETLCTLFGIASLIRFLAMKRTGDELRATSLKVQTSGWFVAAGLFAVVVTGMSGDRGEDAFFAAVLTLAGLFAGLLGDFWLGMRCADPKRGDYLMSEGILCFMLGHAFFWASMILRDGFFLWYLIPAGLAVLTGFVISAAAGKMGLSFGSKRVIAPCYAAFLTTTLYLSVTRLVYIVAGTNSSGTISHRPDLWMVPVGAALFLISDLFLSQSYFGEVKDRNRNDVIVHTTYYAAQFLFAWSALLSGIPF